MTEAQATDRPLPAVPLDYFEPRSATWRPAVELVATVLVVYGWFGVAAFAWECGCFAWQAAAAPSVGAVPVRGWPLVIVMPVVGVSVATAVAASAVRRRPTDAVRRAIVRLLVIECVIGPLTHLATTAYYAVSYPYLGRVSPYAAAYLGGSIASATVGAVVPAAVVVFLRRPEARAVFAESGDK